MASSPVLLIIGAGSNVGLATAQHFKSKGYNVATASRNPSEEIRGVADLALSLDLADASNVTPLFEKVQKQLGIPEVVIYNAFSVTNTEGPNDVTAIPVSDFQHDLIVNNVSSFASAQAAVAGFDKLPASAKKIFMYTGNRGNTAIAPFAFSIAIGKCTAWYMIQTLNAALNARGYRFYYVDERTPEGKGMAYLSGPAHALAFDDVVESAPKGGQVGADALWTFVREKKGLTRFEGEVERAVWPVMDLKEGMDLDYGKPEGDDGQKAGEFDKSQK